MAYTQVDDDFFDAVLNPKRTRLMLLLGPTADIYPVRMWRALRKTSLRRRELCDRFRSVAELEWVCDWPHDMKHPAGKLAAALIDSGFVEKESLVAHGWAEGLNGKAVVQYLDKQKRDAAKRAAAASIDPKNATGIASLVAMFHFCASPGQAAKSSAIADLIRQGVAPERIQAAATDPALRHLPFYEIMKTMQNHVNPTRETGVEKWARLKQMKGETT